MEQPKEQVIHVGPIDMKFFVDGTHTGGSMSMCEMLVPPKARVPPPHYHSNVDETVHVLEGTFDFTVDGKLHELRPGDRCFSPRGLVHSFANRRDEPTRVLSMFTPAEVGPAYFRDVAEIVNAGGPPDLTKMRAVMERYGLVLVP